MFHTIVVLMASSTGSMLTTQSGAQLLVNIGLNLINLWSKWIEYRFRCNLDSLQHQVM